MKKLLLILLLLNISSCSTQIEKRGYIFNEGSQEKLSEGMAKIDVLSLMGSPSTTSQNNGDKFYYISNKFYKYAFLTPREIERTVVVIGFGQDELVATIEEYALRDGKVVDYKSEKTVPGGTQATILQDLFDTSGRYTSSEAIAGSIF
ncbi:MAG: hypothetical protein CML88_02535 [Rhodobiaceae bacterium]|nr:hypothetical protein [Rhodobiaceae bacterium]|tara:strand:+ start:3527 stop:3970 length:444 start_codon:yes stop_codon:yes gene_type:complete